jgi:DNA-binding NtrC family response regulator
MTATNLSVHQAAPASISAPRVLVADDQADVLEALRLLLKPQGFAVETARSPREVLAAVEGRDCDVLLVDLNYARDTTSGREGLELLERLRRLDATLPVIVMTAWGSVEGAVEAMRNGARDYVEKPWDNVRLVATLRSQVELGRALRSAQRLEGENRALRPGARLRPVAESPKMEQAVRLAERVGPSDANVLITGEHGTGKELMAQWLHSVSARAAQPLVTVNVGGFADTMFESEMFGHVRGAFTDAKQDRAGRFEVADGGTLFLDEIANLALPQQAKLLRVLQGGEFERIGSSKTRRVDVRVVSATNADLRAEVEQGRFREDLLFRLNTIEIRIPPLRERREDIPLLAGLFLRRHAERYRKATTGFDPVALQAMLAHSWPGNVRELDHAVERAVLLASGPVVRVGDLAVSAGTPGTGTASLENLTLEEVERVLVQKALERYGGNVSHAAHALGLSRSALYRRIEHHGL